MWTLPLPPADESRPQLLSALTFANGNAVYPISEQEIAAVLLVYEAYDRLLGQPDPSLMPPELTECRNYIEGGYGEVQIGRRLAHLRATLLSATDACPYCGFGEPTELDHYLPKVDYKEVAIYPRNLVPSCGACNNAKRTVAPGVGERPGFIHPYFDVLPDTVFMRANVDFQDGTLNVEFSIEDVDRRIAPELLEKLQYQLERLKLNARYPKQINKFLSEQRTAILRFGDSRQPSGDLANYLTECSKSLADSFGVNDWRAVLLTALAGDVNFCSNPEQYLGVRRFP